jgi:hypothetical protein
MLQAVVSSRTFLQLRPAPGTEAIVGASAAAALGTTGRALLCRCVPLRFFHLRAQLGHPGFNLSIRVDIRAGPAKRPGQVSHDDHGHRNPHEDRSDTHPLS